MNEIFTSALRQSYYENFASFEKAFFDSSKYGSLTLNRSKHALFMGLTAATLGQAFISGYRLALQHLIPELDSTRWAAICITEEEGNHPRKIKTTVNASGEVSGHKTYVALAEKTKQLIVIAKAGEKDGRPLLKAILIDVDESEIHIERDKILPMIPDIPHGKLLIEKVQGRILTGDGYLKFSKQFRCIEDTYLLISFSGFMLRRSIDMKCSGDLIEECIQLTNSLLANTEFGSVTAELSLAASFRLMDKLRQQFNDEIEKKTIDSDFLINWKRDQAIFNVGYKARAIRFSKVREKFAISS